MPAPTQASLTPFFTLTDGMRVRFTALDPTDGSEVSAVVVSNMRIGVDQEDTNLAGAPVVLDPAFLPA